MPDLTISTYLWCEQNEAFATWITGSKGNKYRVSFLSRSSGWFCPCKGFEYHGKCKHIDEAEKLRCTWGEGAAYGSPASPPEDGLCPECGSQLTAVRVAV